MGDSCGVTQTSTDLATKERPLGKTTKTGQSSERIPAVIHAYLPEQHSSSSDQEPEVNKHRGKLSGGSTPLLCGPDEQFPWQTGKKSTASGKMCFFFCGHECTREDNSTVSQPNILLKEHTDLNLFCVCVRLLRIIRETCLMSCPEAHKDNFLWKFTLTTGCWEANATEQLLRK